MTGISHQLKVVPVGRGRFVNSNSPLVRVLWLWQAEKQRGKQEAFEVGDHHSAVVYTDCSGG